MVALVPGFVAWVTAAAVAFAPGVPLVSRTKAPSVVVWPADGSARSSEADAEAVRDAGFDPVPFEAIANAIDDAHGKQIDAERTGLQAVREGLDRAQSHYLGQDWDAMLGELATIEQSSLALLATDTYCGTLWEVEFRRGLGLLSRGEKDDAADRFRFAAALDPDRRPAGDLYGPDVAQAFLAAVEAQKADPKQPITIAAEPADALVVLDCHEVDGKTSRLAPGLHVVRVEAPGHPAVATVIDTRSDRSASVTAPHDESLAGAEAIGRLPTGTSLAREGATWAAAIDQASTAAGAHAHVWLAANDGRYAAQVVVDTKKGRRRVADSRGEAIDLALDDLSPDGRIVMSKPVVDPRDGKRVDADDRSQKKGVARKWWFWTILVVAAGAVAVGLGVGLTRNNDPDRLRLFGPSR